MLRRLSALALLAVVAAPAAAQTTTALASTSEVQALVASGGFSPLLGAIARRGNNATTDTWEQALVTPTGTVLQQDQASWGTMQAIDGSHRFSFSLGRDPGWYGEIFAEGNGAYGGVHREVTPQIGFFTPFNALLIGGIASGSGVGMSFTSALSLRFLGTGDTIEIDPFSGDANGNFVLVVDERLAGGFVIDGMAQLAGGSNYNPAYGFAVGMAPISAVPEPSTYALMATGLAALGGIARRRRRA